MSPENALSDPPIITKPNVEDPPGSGDNDGDDGDADGLSGYGFKHVGGTALVSEPGSSDKWVPLKLWWNFLFWIR